MGYHRVLEQDPYIHGTGIKRNGVRVSICGMSNNNPSSIHRGKYVCGKIGPRSPPFDGEFREPSWEACSMEAKYSALDFTVVYRRGLKIKYPTPYHVVLQKKNLLTT